MIFRRSFGGVKIFAAGHIGNSRDMQEDSFLLPHGETLSDVAREKMRIDRLPYSTCCRSSKKELVAFVSDGMGGQSCGEVASDQTVKYLCEHRQSLIDSIESGKDRIVSEIVRLNRSIVSLSKRDARLYGMGATLCGIVKSGDLCYGINVGDSRLYRFDNGRLVQLSTDHSEGQRLLDLNLLTKEEVKTFPKRKAIYKYVGMDADLIADVFKIPCCDKGTTILLCSDGLTDALDDGEIEAVLSTNMSLARKGMTMLNKALARNLGRGDNITLILLDF